MGIGKVQARAALAAIKLGTNRANALAQVDDAINLLQDWRQRRAAQDREAVQGFAADKPSQFSSYLDALPDVEPDQSP